MATMSVNRPGTNTDTYIENIKLQNFKSFKNLDVTLGRFNLIIGANASGKSNFTQIFEFLKDIMTEGLDVAISRQGGLEYLLNFNLGTNKNLLIEITFRSSTALMPGLFTKTRLRDRLHITKATYRCEIQLKRYPEFKVIDDVWLLELNAYAQNDAATIKYSGNVTFRKADKMVVMEQQFSDNKVRFENIPEFVAEDTDSKSLLIQNYFLKTYLGDIGGFFSQMEIYDFDPKLAKETTSLKGTPKLLSDGSNLALVLKNVLEDENNRRSFYNLMSDVLCFVDSADTEKFVDRSILFTIHERYFKDKSIPSTFVSDGTVNITALILALYFHQNMLAIIEEPERNIHPYLMSRVVEMMKEISGTNQIIATTHNPEMVRHAGIDNVLTIRRNSDGYSEAIKPADQDDIQKFLKHDIGIEELYVQNLLGD